MKHFFSSVALFTACCLTTSSDVMAQSWTPVGTAGFSSGIAGNTDISLNSNGIPYVAFRDNNNGNKATVMKYNGTSWTTVGNEGFSSGAITNVSIALDGSSTPYVVYADGSNSNKITVMKYDGDTWVTLGTPSYTSASAPAVIKVYNGTPYILFSNDNNNYKATVLSYNGTSWNAVGTSGFSTGQAMDPDMAFDASGAPYVVYAEGASSTVTVKKYSGSSWSTVGNAGFTVVASYHTRIAVSSTGTPYVSFQDGYNNYTATVMKFNGSAWANVGTAGFSGTSANDMSMAVDGSGTPYVVYAGASPSSKANVKKFNGTVWVTVGTADFSVGTAGNTKISINSSNIPYVVYTDGGNSYKATVMSFNNTPLPVTLTDFSATAVNGYNKLNWKVATESKGIVYSIERSSNGKDFILLNTRTGSGNNSAYVYEDKYIPSGLTYYRIKMTESDGIQAYSKIVMVERTQNSSRVALYPVPAENFCILENNVTALNGTMASVYNLQGVQVATFSITEGTQRIEMMHWAPGVYTVHLADGSVLRLVKK